jgi:hypothetical protein
VVGLTAALEEALGRGVGAAPVDSLRIGVESISPDERLGRHPAVDEAQTSTAIVDLRILEAHDYRCFGELINVAGTDRNSSSGLLVPTRRSGADFVLQQPPVLERSPRADRDP